MGYVEPQPTGVAYTRIVKESRLERLVEVGQQLVRELDLETLLTQIIEVGRDMTGARYGALGVIDADRSGFERFVSVGVSAEESAAIGDPPRGRGLLRVLVDDPRPLRLDDLGGDPRSFGFPASHPPMRSFLGVPIVTGGELWGELYLTEKVGAPFDSDDEQAAMVLADWAGVAVSNARLFAAAADRGEQLEPTVRGLEASTEVAIALDGPRDLPRIVEQVVERARKLVGARTAVAGLVEDARVRLAGAAGDGTEVVRGLAVGPADLLTVSALRGRGPERLSDVRMRRCAVAEALGAVSALVVPLRHGDRRLGVLIAFDRQGEGGKGFSLEDERALAAFTVSATSSIASALDTAREVARRLVRATEQERGRFARELHDATVQELGALRLALSAAAREQDIGVMRKSVVASAVRTDEMIGELRRLITELRPAALDQIGLGAALAVLIHDFAEQSGLEITLDADLADEVAGGGRLDPDLEAAPTGSSRRR